MKTRIISAAFGIAFFIFVMCFYNTIILNLAVALICSIMVYEVFHATKILEQSFFAFIACEIFSIACAFCNFSSIKNLNMIFLVCYGAVFLFVLFKNYGSIKIENLVFTFSFSVFLTFAMNILLEIRNKFYPFGAYYTILLFSIAWVCDTGAYFVGLKFGKRKLAPQISPKKTIEGAIGGVIFNLLFITISNLTYFSCAGYLHKVNMVSLMFIIIIGSICAIVGDLSMSIVKRSYDIKDFSNIMQGHGGILDRFDSYIFVSIVAYPFLLNYPIV